MGSHDRKSIHSGYAVTRLQHRVCRDATRKVLCHKPPKRCRKSPGYDGPAKGPEATGSCLSSTSGGTTSGILFPHIFDKETIGGFSSYIESETTKQVSSVQKVSNGLNSYSQNPVNKRMLHGINRFKGCLPTYPNSPSLTEIPKVGSKSGKGNAPYPIQSTPFRAIIIPSYLYEGNGRVFSSPPPSGNLCGALPGRPAFLCPVKGKTSRGPAQGKRSSRSSGMDSEHQEIESHTGSAGSVPRVSVMLCGTKNLPTRRQTGQNTKFGSKATNKSVVVDQRDHVSPWKPDCINSSCPMGKAAFSTTPIFPPQNLGSQSRDFGLKGKNPHQGQEVPLVVEKSDNLVSGFGLVLPGRPEVNNGCQQLGVGSPLEPKPGTGGLVSDRDKKILKLEGIKGSRPSPNCLLSKSSGDSCSSPFRQRHYSGISKQARGHKKQNPTAFGNGNSAMGGKAVTFLVSNPPKRYTKQCGGLFKQAEDPRSRMELEPRSLYVDNQDLGKARGGSVCNERKRKTSTLLLTPQKRQLSGSRFPGTSLEVQVGVCLPPLPAHSIGVEKNPNGKSLSDPDHTLLAQKGLVFDCPSTVSQTCFSAPSSSRPTASRYSLSSRSGKAKAHRLVSEEQLLKRKGFSDALIATLLSSRKKVTRNIYAKVWKTYNTWCESKDQKLDSIVSILEFLQEGAGKGLAVSTLKVQVTALGVFLERPISSESLIIRFFRALTRSRPVPIRSFPKWDLSVVLQAFTKEPFEPLETVTLKNLTLKTVFLVAITSARRISELHALSAIEPFLSIYPDRIILKTDPGFLPKVASTRNRSQEIVLPTFCPNPSGDKEESFHYLDVRRVLIHYLEVTKEFRSSNSLFVLFSGNKKGRQASKGSIARWLRSAISEAYSQMKLSPPQGIRAHSTRALATTWAEKAGATPDQICKAATWSSYFTFARPYRLDLLAAEDQAFGRKVLQAVVPP